MSTITIKHAVLSKLHKHIKEQEDSLPEIDMFEHKYKQELRRLEMTCDGDTRVEQQRINRQVLHELEVLESVGKVVYKDEWSDYTKHYVKGLWKEYRNIDDNFASLSALYSEQSVQEIIDNVLQDAKNRASNTKECIIAQGTSRYGIYDKVANVFHECSFGGHSTLLATLLGFKSMMGMAYSMQRHAHITETVNETIKNFEFIGSDYTPEKRISMELNKA